MRIKSIAISNFRGYENEVQTNFENLTAFVGKNDAGKSSILEALDIFFNEGKGCVKIDSGDINKNRANADDKEIRIKVCFDDLPERIIIDATNETTLQSEHLLNHEGLFEVIKKYPNAGSAKVYIRAYHPTNPECKDLLLKKQSELKGIIETKGIECEERVKNAVMRQAIWNNYVGDLQEEVIDIDVTKGDTKPIFEKLQSYFPIYTLFQVDRKNTDADDEVQDPLMGAVKEILAEPEIKGHLQAVADAVKERLGDVSGRTLDKLREMAPEVANSLNPVLPNSDTLKWKDVFKGVTITGDDIPINKRGSGVKRLILLNFFRAEAERRLATATNSNIIYAIEEPETSQHTENQKKLIDALLVLSGNEHTQIIITTHSANIVKRLHFNNLRLIKKENGFESITPVEPGQLPYPSLNEVNYLAFSEISTEYHNELFGHIEEENWMTEYNAGKPTRNYIKQGGHGVQTIQSTLTRYIRDQIHHPENTLNTHFTDAELEESIGLMRAFIASKNLTT